MSRITGATVELVDALHHLGGDALAAGEYERARAYTDACLALARQAGYPRGVARALWAFGSISYIEHDGDAARLQLEASIAAARELSAWWEIAQASAWHGHLSADEGDAASAALFFQTRELSQQLGDSQTICTFLEGALIWPRPQANPSGRCAWRGRPQPSARPLTQSCFPWWGVSSTNGLRLPAQRWADRGRRRCWPPGERCH